VQNRFRQDKGMVPWGLRIGVHTGPIVAGVVGRKKYAYDIWGNTVNIASRMESNGEVGKVNISSATYNMVKDSYKCEYRGKISAKNIGEIDMYFIDSAIITPLKQ
jgi:class 3 adenylate cyclase